MPLDIADVAEVIYYVEDSSSPLTIVKPAAFSPGELLLFIHSQDFGSASDLTAPATGWTLQGSYDNVPAATACKVWSHPYDASDPGTWDFAYNSGASTVGIVARIPGADVTPVINVTSFAGSVVSGTIDSPSITPSGINDLLLCVIGDVCAGGSPFSKTDPAGMANRGSAQVANLWNALGLASRQLTDGNATGAKTWTSVSPNSGGGSLSITIKSSGFLDPDPPPNPPPAIVPPWMLRELIGQKQLPVRGDQGTPVIKEKLSGGASGANVTLVTGATTATGDILVAFHGNNFYTAAQLLTPTGTAGTWSLATTGDNGSNSAHMKIWTRKVTVDGAQTVTVAPAVDEEHSIHLFVVSGADQTTWVDVAAGSNGASSTSHIAPTVDPTVFNALLLVGAQSTSLGNYTIPSTLGMAKQMEVDVGGFCTSATGAEVLGNDAPTGTRTFTLTAAGAYASASIALRPVQDVVTGGGTTFPVSVAGGMTPSGVLARQPNRLLAGTGTSSGVVQRQPQKTQTGGLTPAGVMQRVTGKLFGGALTPTGALATIRLRVLAFTGGLTPTGALTRQTSKLMAGGFTPAGSLIRQVGKSLAGAATPAGTLANIRSRLIALAGSLSPTATLVRQTNKPLAGAEAPTGALVKQTAKHPTGAITPSGVASLIRSRLLAIAGALTPSGQLARTPGKATAGAITPAATVTRVVGKRTSGALIPTGVVTLVRNRVLAIVGTLTPSGSLTRRPARSVTGSMTSSGVVTRRVGKSASGGLGFTGAVLKLVGKLLGGSETPSGDVLIVDNPVVIAWPPSADSPVVSRRFTAGQPTITAAATAGAPRVTHVASADPPLIR
jgi:hypothetical protein